VRPGTPAYFWAAANETFKKGDHPKTSDYLTKVSSSKDYIQRAQPWQMIIDAGVAQGYMDLADRFETGGKVNKANAMDFSRHVSQYRTAANSAAMQFVETLHNFLDANKDQEITLAMPPPPGTAAEPTQIQRVPKGVLVPEAEAASLERSMLQRGVLLSTARAAGVGDDAAKVVQMLRQGPVKVPRDEFLRAMAQSLYDRAELYMPRKMDQPKRLQMLYGVAVQALKSVNQNKNDKELNKKMQDTLKKYRLS
jgi:hypothetical protein